MSATTTCPIGTCRVSLQKLSKQCPQALGSICSLFLRVQKQGSSHADRLVLLDWVSVRGQYAADVVGLVKL